MGLVDAGERAQMEFGNHSFVSSTAALCHLQTISALMLFEQLLDGD